MKKQTGYKIILTVLAALVLCACGGQGAKGGTSGAAPVQSEEQEASMAEEGSESQGQEEEEDKGNVLSSAGEAPESAGESAAEGGEGTESAGENSASGEDSASGEETLNGSGTVKKGVVRKHKEEGTHMVTAGSMTISVPTTFEGLEMEGAEFEGDTKIVKAGGTGNCRVKYKGAFNSIRINVKNNQDYDMAVRDCTIKGIEIASQEPDPDLTLFGIPMGATRQEIADVYGEPFSKTFDDDKGMSNMVYQFGTDIYSQQVVMIIFKDKKAVMASYDDFSLVVK